ncbi:hypothetical protein [Variovorax ginsengisoli]|uniref:Lipoprotein n=1 Tax=Variovorax ginsengisoli TaxID=363844 RepID=A0ABT9SFA1_9BURK|nr:hypothetical protein [Variovorax ginsengisoli]MDP9903041.1 hypothetical protein [Variovorax ginsengisoli]
MVDTVTTLYKGSPEPDASAFNPKFRYLRTVFNGKVFYLALGNTEQRPEGTVEVWYSGGGEVVRLLDGRVYSTSGLPVDWRQARFNPAPALPAWSTAATRFVRERDVMPGYRFSIRDEVVRTPVAPPRSSGIKGTAAASLQWYEERSASTPAAASLPPALFAVSVASGAPQVIYSEQCLTTDLCMSFERWTPNSPVAANPTRSGT